MRKNVLLIPPCSTYGDSLSIIGLLYFLLDFYKNVHFLLETNYTPDINEYYKNFFLFDDLFNKRIFLLNDPTEILERSEYGDLDIVNLKTGDWKSAKTDFISDKIEFYFNDLNPLYKRLDILKKYQYIPNINLPIKNIEINHIVYYKLIGLNNDVRMDFFNYVRNKNEEDKYKKNILNNHLIREGDKYNIINNPNNSNFNKLNIENEFPIINISMLSPFPGFLISLIENAETINFIEGSNVNFFYHCQYKNILKTKADINLHVYERNRSWPQYNLDFAWKMMNYPKLSNWNFIF